MSRMLRTAFNGLDVLARDSLRHGSISVVGRSQDLVASKAWLVVQTAAASKHTLGWLLPHTRCGIGNRHHQERAYDAPSSLFVKIGQMDICAWRTIIAAQPYERPP